MVEGPFGALSRARLRRSHGIAVLLAVIAGACGGPSSSSGVVASPAGASAVGPSAVGPSAVGPSAVGPSAVGPSAASVLASTWTMAAVDQPVEVTGAPSSVPKFCSPCHDEATLAFGVATTPFGLVAVGLQQPPPGAAAWRSDDGRRWTRIANLPVTDASVAVAAVSDASRVVLVGADPAGATSWASTDGSTWLQAPASPALAGPAAATRMTSVVAWRGGFIAGGNSDDPAANRTSAAIWTSSDGLAWQRLPDDPTFHGAHILALATAGERALVAVGSLDSQTSGGSAAWVSADGVHWTRSTAPALAAGVMRGVTAFGAGFEAVGLTATDDRALTWTSPDGLAWTAQDGGPALTNFGLPVRMMAVAPAGSGLTAVGWKSDGGNGSAVVWRSADGVGWVRVDPPPAFSGAEMTGVLAAGPGLIAVGTSGYPDNDQATLWTSGP